MKTYSNEHVMVTVDCGVHLLHQTWLGLPASRPFRDGCSASLTLAERHRVKRWLIDLRQLRIFNPVDLQWYVQRWLPQAMLRLPQSLTIAIVLSETNQFGKLGADLMLRSALKLNNALMSRYFLDEDAARQWLLIVH